jgi:hypothetical protein
MGTTNERLIFDKGAVNYHEVCELLPSFNCVSVRTPLAGIRVGWTSNLINISRRDCDNGILTFVCLISLLHPAGGGREETFKGSQGAVLQTVCRGESENDAADQGAGQAAETGLSWRVMLLTRPGRGDFASLRDLCRFGAVGGQGVT